jgi:hypothetical protein
MLTGSFVFEITTPDFMTAVDLQDRFTASAHAQVMPAVEGSVVVVTVRRPRLRTALSSLAAWLENYDLSELEVRVNQRPFTLQRQMSGRLKWHDAEGAELDDIEMESAARTSVGESDAVP